MPASDAKLNEALVFHQNGQLTQAKAIYEEILSTEPNCADALYLLGSVYFQTNNFERAVTLFNQVIAINPHSPDVYFNHGLALQELKQWEAAVASYDRAINIQPNFIDAYLNRGNALQKLMQFEAAIQNYSSAITLQPNYADAYVGRGIALQALMQFENAIDNYDRAIAMNPNLVAAYGNRANALVQLRRLDEALTDYGKAFAMNANFEYLLGLLTHTRMKCCDWTDLDKNSEELSRRIERGEKTTECFPLLSITESLSIQRKAAENWISQNCPSNSALGTIPKHPKSQKIRIGYFSADFHLHAVSILLAELFELHDKNHFEIMAFSLGPDIKDDMRQRLIGAFDQFINVRHYSDQAVALLARQMHVDIAVDLTGTTIGGRPGIFSYRAAPIQVSYIGYLGTMGADYYDYLLADKIIIPKDAQSHYAEKIVYLPSYQANDSKRVVSEKIFTRTELGLPDEGFVFCCFNNNYKITPAIFSSWMRILKAVPKSVLFLYADNEWALRNLKNEAQIRGVDPARLVFGGKLEPSEYLARYKAADLFLDTLPYNAGTTASDALWVGLPVLTLCGKTFAGRIASSLLTAIDLPELITHTLESYEALASEFATNPDKLNVIKEKLAANKLTTKLFNTPLFTTHLEDAYRQMVERYQADLAADHIFVGEKF